MQAVFEKIIEKLEEKARFYNSASDVDQNIRSGVIIAKEIVQETAAEYEVCYNDCGDCEAYNKEKHHCPKFCKVIKETVKEIEENRNGWIPCSEHQPEEAGTYNVTAYDGRILRSTHAKWQPRLKSWNLTGTMAYWKIIAWMELPSAYRPKEK